MNFFKQWGQFMMMGAKAHARWELGVSNAVFSDKPFKGCKKLSRNSDSKNIC